MDPIRGCYASVTTPNNRYIGLLWQLVAGAKVPQRRFCGLDPVGPGRVFDRQNHVEALKTGSD